MAYHLQFIGASIGFYRTSLTLLVQEKRSAENGQKRVFLHFFKKIFFDWFLSKVNDNRPPLFFGVSHGEHVSKVIHFGEKNKITKKFVKNHDFLEKFGFCDFNFSAYLEVYTCARSTSFYSFRVKKSKKFDFVAIFQKMLTRDVFCQAYAWYPKFFYV